MANVSKSTFFKAAWAVAKNAAQKFGGSAREYIASALRTGYEMLAKRAAKTAEKPAEKSTAAKIDALMGIMINWSRDARKSFAWRFVADNSARLDKFGARTTFSAKQVEIINDLYAKYA